MAIRPACLLIFLMPSPRLELRTPAGYIHPLSEIALNLLYFCLVSCILFCCRFITNPVLTAASLISVTTTTIALTHAHHHIICMCYILSHSVQHFLSASSKILKSVLDCALPRLKPISVPNASVI